MFIEEEAIYYDGDWDSGSDIEDEAEAGDGGMEGAKEASENAVEEGRAVESNTGGEAVAEQTEQRQRPPTISITLSLKAWKDILNIFKPTESESDIVFKRSEDGLIQLSALAQSHIFYTYVKLNRWGEGEATEGVILVEDMREFLKKYPNKGHNRG